MNISSGLACAVVFAAGCSHMPGGHGVPSSVPSTPSVPGGASGEVDPDTCGNYAASDAGAKLKAFLQATKDLKTSVAETAKVVKQSCITMGQSLGVGDLGGDDTNAICNKVIAAYQDNLKVSLKSGAHASIKFTPAKCTVDASASASAGGGCSGGASAGAGGGGAGGSCAAAASVNASLHATCEPAHLEISAGAKLVVDKSKFDMTVKAMQDGLPQLFEIGARMKYISAAVDQWAKAASDLKDMGPKFAQSFGDQAMCVTGQLGAAVNAATNVHAEVSVSVTVSASASGSVGG